MLLSGMAKPVGRDRAPVVQAPAQAPGRRGRSKLESGRAFPPSPNPTAKTVPATKRRGLPSCWPSAGTIARTSPAGGSARSSTAFAHTGTARRSSPGWATVFMPPTGSSRACPTSPLDGELWIGRKAFQRTVGIVRRQDKTDLWKQVRYVVFDAPAFDAAFEGRLAAIRAHIERYRPPYLTAHEHAVCTDLDHLRAELARIEALGGEGLMLRQPESRYEVGRSLTLLKVKTFHDAEARVLEHLKGAGRHKGRLGALLVELADGTQFSVGTGFSDAERGAPPPVGSVITFRYQELSDGGVPRFPSYVGVRSDAAAAAPLPASLRQVEREFRSIDVPDGKVREHGPVFRRPLGRVPAENPVGLAHPWRRAT